MKKKLMLLSGILMVLFSFAACDMASLFNDLPGTIPADDDVIVTPGNSSSTLPPADVHGKGPFDTEYKINYGPHSNSGVFNPKNLGQDGLKHPLFVWGCGGGSQPRAYIDHFTQMASHGFVIVAEVSTGQGRVLKDSIDWLEKQNSDPSSKFYQKLDTSKIAAGGHSMGSITTFAMADDPRLTTTIHVAGGSFNGQGSTSLRNPTLYISGETDMARSNCERDYRNTNNVPVFFTIMDGVDHIMCAREGLPVMTAWLRWFLAGETDLASMFFDGGEFTRGKYNGVSKGWENYDF